MSMYVTPTVTNSPTFIRVEQPSSNRLSSHGTHGMPTMPIGEPPLPARPSSKQIGSTRAFGSPTLQEPERHPKLRQVQDGIARLHGANVPAGLARVYDEAVAARAMDQHHTQTETQTQTQAAPSYKQKLQEASSHLDKIFRDGGVEDLRPQLLRYDGELQQLRTEKHHDIPGTTRFAVDHPTLGKLIRCMISDEKYSSAAALMREYSEAKQDFKSVGVLYNRVRQALRYHEPIPQRAPIAEPQTRVVYRDRYYEPAYYPLVLPMHHGYGYGHGFGYGHGGFGFGGC